ncbi:3'-5' exoribonuclease 1-like [Physella acuta]|uniref:3'-5' exoribonuclease 1-like n=1 Tax=Physella acuta TaxID=109671 RepID=UPI0027DAED7C|nr:3'-5' exoribonuclease 1-like [Physella acuta]XP_059165854.1 3'-5' exoribonuclease 1-like [Physella acuta]
MDSAELGASKSVDSSTGWVHDSEISCWDASMAGGESKTDQGSHRSKARLDSSVGGATLGEEIMSKLSRINGAINKMSKEQMQTKLAEIHLSTSGVKDVLKKRLKNYYKRQKLSQLNKPLLEEEKMKYDYLVVIDFEATCSETNENFVHEIIEFPAVLIDTKNNAVCNVFQRFCKPNVNPILTDFCTSLTGISQQQVDKAKDFTQVFAEFEEWMAIHKLGTEHEFAILTDGPWDMARFLKTQTELSGIPFPRWAKQWINLRKAYTAFYACGRVNLHQMLEELGMKFQGRPHCGLDDARNIAAIALRLLQDGCIMRINEHYREGVISPQKSNSSSRGNRSAGSHRSPPKSRMTQKHVQKDQGREPYNVHQEGENLSDLMEYLKLQKS